MSPPFTQSNSFNRPSPVLLSSNCTVTLGNSASPDMTKLAYPYRRAVLIDEIRFDMWADAATHSYFNLGALIYVKLSLGQHYLMRDPVPVWILGTSMDLNQEQIRDNLVETAQTISHYRWRLPEPLYIEAGQTLRPVFTRVANPTSLPAGDITVQVSYAGRVVPPNAPRPGVLAVPYAAPFVTAFGTANGVATFAQSNEYHLFNPFDKPVKVQRLTGRVFQTNATFDPTLSFGGQVFGGAITGLNPTASGVTAGVTVLIDDSWGGKMVNNPTGVGDVFDVLRSAWTVDTVIPAKGQYNVQVRNIAATGGFGQTTVRQQVHIAMVGVREEAL